MFRVARSQQVSGGCIGVAPASGTVQIAPGGGVPHPEEVVLSLFPWLGGNESVFVVFLQPSKSPYDFFHIVVAFLSDLPPDRVDLFDNWIFYHFRLPQAIPVALQG